MTKTQIFGEIRRTAEANGGVPLGWRRFLAETAIKESDWLGKYWARWSEALREAGFTPNELQGAYEDAELLEKYAKLVHELGRLPTEGDMRLKAHRDSTLPSVKTFRRLGTKQELIARLVEYCRSRDGHADVVLLCEGYVARRKDVVVEEEVSGEGAMGFVYLLKSGRFYKIGRSNSVGRREYELGIQLPEPVTTVHAIPTDDPVGIEAYWHKRFEAKRKNGEWFELDAADVAVFKRRKFM